MIRNGVEIGTLRVLGTQQTKATLRRRLIHQLNKAELLPTTIPPAAILLVRRLADPRPGSLVTSRGTLQIDSRWEDAVRASLSESYRQATRTQRGRIVGNPDAIRFVDEAEMLACLSLALVTGQPLIGWWWRVILCSLGDRPHLTSVWRARPAVVPAALHYLATWGEAVHVVEQLAPAEALALLPVLAAAYDLPDLDPTLSDPWLETQSARQRHMSEGESIPVQQLSSAPTPPPPWRRWLPPTSVPSTLGRAHAVLLGIALTLHVRPAAVRNATFRADLHRWWHAATRDKSTDPQTEPRRKTAPEGSLVAQSNRVTKQAQEKRDEHQIPHPIKSAEAGITSTTRVAKKVMGAYREKNSGKATSTTPWREHRVPGSEEAITQHPLRSPEALRQITDATDSTEILAAEGLFSKSDGAVTALGGVLYLINVMRALNLPDCFEAGWGLASQVGPWAVLELLGRGLLGRAGAGYDDDPLWRVLAELDSRSPPTLPGVTFEMRGPGGLPPGWEATGNAEWCLDTSPLLDGVNPALREWLALALPPLARDLQKALHVEPGRVHAALLAVGRLYVTHSHIDLVMALDAVSLPVRRAGLDANPGWLPTFGRVVTFYFQ